MADVQIEHGYTKLANELLEQTMKLKLSPTQFKIVLAVWRYTYGFNRKDHEMSLSFIANAINAHKQNVKTDIDKLVERKILIVTEEASYSKTRRLAFNKDYDQWDSNQSVKQLTVSQTTYSPVSQTTYSPVSQTTYSPVSQTTYQEININKNINKSSSSEKEKVFSFYHQNLQIGVSSSPFVYEQIDYWINDMSAELVLAAMKLSAKKEKKGFDYTEGILKKWVEANVQTLEDARKHEKSFKQRRTAPVRKQLRKEDFDLSE